MKKLVLLLPLLILLGSIAGIFILDDGKSDPQLEAQAKKGEIKKMVPQTVSFDAAIPNYFALNMNEAVSYEKMRVYPIISSNQYEKDHAALAKYLNLEEGLATGKIQIMELGETERQRNSGVLFNPNPLNNPIIVPDSDRNHEVQTAYAQGASVNTLTVENTSNDPVYIMAGEIVQGGRQDRVIAEDQIIAANSGKVAVPVFCVEPGRWSFRDKPVKTTTNNSNGNIYAFTGYFNVASNDIRHTVKHKKDQGQVWAKVGEMRNRHNINGDKSTTYGDLANSKGFIKTRDAYIENFATAFDENEKVIGFMVVSGTEVLGSDIFATHDLFKKQYKVLLHSYVTESITYGKKIRVENATVQDHFDNSMNKYFSKQADEKQELELKFVQDNKVVHFTDI